MSSQATISAGRPITILLCEDNEHDVFLTRKAMARAGLDVRLERVANGEECMDLLRLQARGEAGVPLPDLLLLDLNMPLMDGREVLAEIVADETLRMLPVVVLTTSSSERDVLEMYRLRCSSFMTKPVDFDDFVRAMRRLGQFWLQIAALPRHRMA